MILKLQMLLFNRLGDIPWTDTIHPVMLAAVSKNPAFWWTVTETGMDTAMLCTIWAILLKKYRVQQKVEK